MINFESVPIKNINLAIINYKIEHSETFNEKFEDLAQSKECDGHSLPFTTDDIEQLRQDAFIALLDEQDQDAINSLDLTTNQQEDNSLTTPLSAVESQDDQQPDDVVNDDILYPKNFYPQGIKLIPGKIYPLLYKTWMQGKSIRDHLNYSVNNGELQLVTRDQGSVWSSAVVFNIKAQLPRKVNNKHQYITGYTMIPKDDLSQALHQTTNGCARLLAAGEVFSSTNQTKLFFDIDDIPKEEEEKLTQLLPIFVDEVYSLLADEKRKLTGGSKPNWVSNLNYFRRVKGDKISYHIHETNITIADTGNQFITIIKPIINLLNAKLEKADLTLIDTAPYGDNRSLRVPHLDQKVHQLGTGYKFEWVGHNIADLTPKDYISTTSIPEEGKIIDTIGDLKSNSIFRQMCIIKTLGDETKEQSGFSRLEADDKEMVLELLNSCEELPNDWTILSYDGNKGTFNVLSTTARVLCPCCENKHDSQCWKVWKNGKGSIYVKNWSGRCSSVLLEKGTEKVKCTAGTTLVKRILNSSCTNRISDTEYVGEMKELDWVKEKIHSARDDGSKYHIGIQSPTGTGKTWFMREIVNQAQTSLIKKSVLIVAHSKALCKSTYWDMKEKFPKSSVEIYSDFGDDKRKKYSETTLDIYVTTPNSLSKVPTTFDIIFYDEIASILQSLTGDTMRTRLGDFGDTNALMQKNARFSFMIDAHITRDQTELIVASDMEKYFYINDYAYDRGTFTVNNIVKVDDKQLLRDKASVFNVKKDLQDGKKVVFTADNKTLIDSVVDASEDIISPSEVLVVYAPRIPDVVQDISFELGLIKRKLAIKKKELLSFDDLTETSTGEFKAVEQDIILLEPDPNDSAKRVEVRKTVTVMEEIKVDDPRQKAVEQTITTMEEKLKELKEKMSEWIKSLNADQTDYVKKLETLMANKDNAEFWSKYKLVCYSPSICVGIDFNNTGFNVLHGFFGNLVSSFAVSQMVRRFRDVREFHLQLAGGLLANGPINFHRCVGREFRVVEDAIVNHTNNCHKILSDIKKNGLLNVVVISIVLANCCKINFREITCYLLEKDGIKMVESTTTDVGVVQDDPIAQVMGCDDWEDIVSDEPLKEEEVVSKRVKKSRKLMGATDYNLIKNIITRREEIVPLLSGYTLEPISALALFLTTQVLGLKLVGKELILVTDLYDRRGKGKYSKRVDMTVKELDMDNLGYWLYDILDKSYFRGELAKTPISRIEDTFATRVKDVCNNRGDRSLVDEKRCGLTKKIINYLGLFVTGVELKCGTIEKRSIKVGKKRTTISSFAITADSSV